MAAPHRPMCGARRKTLACSRSRKKRACCAGAHEASSQRRGGLMWRCFREFDLDLYRHREIGRELATLSGHRGARPCGLRPARRSRSAAAPPTSEDGRHAGQRAPPDDASARPMRDTKRGCAEAGLPARSSALNGPGRCTISPIGRASCTPRMSTCACSRARSARPSIAIRRPRSAVTTTFSATPSPVATRSSAMR